MELNLRNQKILLAVSGSVAAYKALELARELVRAGAEVQPVLTHAALSFVTPLSFQALCSKIPKTDLFDLESEKSFGHIDMARWADLVLLAPVTANRIAATALGLGGDYLSTLLLANQKPLLLAPAMNHAMWSHPATQGHVATLQSRGAHFVGPQSGELACGEVGLGRFAELSQILGKVRSILCPALPLAGKKVLVTAGPTREKIDAVRFLSNRSSGKMGFALAQAALDLGAAVTLVSGPVALTPPLGVEFVPVETALEMREAVMQRFGTTDLVIKNAAVADYRAKHSAQEKVKKTGDLSLELVQNPDILAELGRLKAPGQVVVGFAAETKNLEGYAREKLLAKQVDWIIGNDLTLPQAGFDKDQNQVLVVSRQGTLSLGPAPKGELAQEILLALLADPVLGPKLGAKAAG
ncbi:MAG: hypothetical protein A2600_05180 [Candidatus Lambdaproteobacteria bacterium RIFOXYD1_FULL_56_27]|uniref:Coenzyme A biosynthesis bifunctional protein CoaBC n=1 Tax=Candidatus Lambdaproteobacteria bacterium RIFOXYD2_FULL_56_26 TaxID=1817773 RepID=A0A1F6GRU5_9PROT|nr:MAG: hypothetical protein A2426_08035 [Candidatus Lambdaproteobacteria bacterium RIFOXYC1_FULL_56_13]OGH00789.1 MAG: hypothetical protein A2557_03705 [Candidatus Lambdaproteobacteria bacterium RIFOXYD2_FULL_56_26]OGH09946.1 MAG: hypothetical protein A2600_05180 [Candidatus Lambdaproteobacteria bacterium RIFOXYD1_FULL_56_27]